MLKIFQRKKRNYNRRYKEDYGIIRTVWITIFLKVCVNFAATFMYGVEVQGRENIEKGKRYIFTGNHQSYIDPPLLSIVADHPVAYMAKEELFTHKNLLLRFLVISLGAFAVNREKPELATFKTIKDIVENSKWSIGIFPEGKISKDKTVSNIQKGFAVVAKKAKMDIVPVAITNFDGYAKKFFDKHIILKIGKPISYKLPEEEIVNQWVDFICKEAEYTLI